MTVYLCLKDLDHIPVFGDGSNGQEVVDWTLKHRSHEVVSLDEFTEGTAKRL